MGNLKQDIMKKLGNLESNIQKFAHKKFLLNLADILIEEKLRKQQIQKSYKAAIHYLEIKQENIDYYTNNSAKEALNAYLEEKITSLQEAITYNLES